MENMRIMLVMLVWNIGQYVSKKLLLFFLGYWGVILLFVDFIMKKGWSFWQGLVQKWYTKVTAPFLFSKK